MIRLAAVISVLTFLVPVQSAGGIPVQRTATCPVGGAEFTFAGTESCSELGRTMSFRPITSCEFVTQLPVCPDNGLPVYQDFSPAHIEQLEDFVITDAFAALKKLPPWHRAYGVAEHLGQAGSPIGFEVLINALWYEGDVFLSRDETITQFLAELDAELGRTDAQSGPFLNAIAGYALSAAGRMEDANARLTLAAEAEDIPDYLKSYIAAIRACQSDMTRAGCRPQDQFQP